MNKWQEKAIKALVNKGYDELTASRLYARAYRRLSKSVLSTGFDRSFEAYMALISENNFVRFDIRNNRLYYANTGEEVSSESFEKNYTTSRLSAFSEKYETIADYVEMYKRGEITLSQLNELIKKFKKENAEYHKEGS